FFVLGKELLGDMRAAAGQEDTLEFGADAEIRQGFAMPAHHGLEHCGEQVQAVGAQLEVAERCAARFDLEAIAAQKRRVQADTRLALARRGNRLVEELLRALLPEAELMN